MDDPGHAHVLPRPALPDFFAKEFRKYTPNATFGTNPCRIRFYDQEIVIFRHDQLNKMKRLSLIDSSLDESQKVSSFQRLSWTVLHQSHLAPLPLPSCPLYWEFDHALRIFPLPHTVSTLTSLFIISLIDLGVLNKGALFPLCLLGADDSC